MKAYKWIIGGGLGLITLLGPIGCVAQDEYDRAAVAARSLEAQKAELEQERLTLLETIALKDAELARMSGQAEQLRAQLEERERLMAQLAEAQQRIAMLDQATSNLTLGGLDPVTDRSLRQLAAQYPGLIAYNPQSGTLSFTSDLTFASGSAQVREEAREGLRRLAEILTSAEAGRYIIEVVGHTDSQTISNPTTLANHPNNRYLSVHRAIEVSQVLQSYGLPAARVKVSGWGQYRPVVPNAADGGTPANRRVEVRLLADSWSGATAGLPSAAPPPQPAERMPVRERFPIK